MKHNFSALILGVLFASCSSVKVIKYQPVPNDIYANKNLKGYFQGDKSPKIVLRVPNSNDKATSNTSTQNAAILYNAIEKEFLKNGFSVRDRGLFNEIINKTSSSDYSKIGESTDTDLILEVVSIDPTVVYSTNKITTVNGKKTQRTFKLLIIKNTGLQ